MTKIIHTWRERLINYLQNRKEKERQTEKELAFESIMHLLNDNLSLEESIEMFEQVQKSFIWSCKEQLVEVNGYKEALEKFLS
jgi:hypothetical protein